MNGLRFEVLPAGGCGHLPWICRLVLSGNGPWQVVDGGLVNANSAGTGRACTLGNGRGITASSRTWGTPAGASTPPRRRKYLRLGNAGQGAGEPFGADVRVCLWRLAAGGHACTGVWRKPWGVSPDPPMPLDGEAT